MSPLRATERDAFQVLDEAVAGAAFFLTLIFSVVVRPW